MGLPLLAALVAACIGGLLWDAARAHTMDRATLVLLVFLVIALYYITRFL